MFNEPVEALTLNTDIMAWVSRSTKTVTATNASNVLNATSHGLSNGGRVMLSTTGTTTLRDWTLFNGLNNSLSATDGVLGNADGKSFLISFWMDFNSNSRDGMTNQIYANNGNAFYMQRRLDNKLEIEFENAAGGKLYQATTTANLTYSSGLTHVLLAVDLTNTTVHLYLNDAAPSLSITTAPVNDTINFAAGTFNVGAGGGSFHGGNLGQFYIAQEYLDVSILSNRRKFINADLTPVDFGADGSEPTGNQPIIFLNNPFGTFQNNLGSGGNFTVGGTLAQGIKLTETDLPTGLSTLPTYHVVNKTANTFQVAATNGGAAVTFSDDGTGTHSARSLTSIPLADKGDYGTGKAILAGTADITGQPTGTDVRLIVQTKNSKETKLHGMAVQYGKKD